MTLTSRCGVLLVAISLVGAAPSAAHGGGPRGGPRKRVAVTDVDVKVGGVVSGTPVSVNVASPARRRGAVPGASPAAVQTQPSADPWGNPAQSSDPWGNVQQQQNAGQVASPQQPSSDPWGNPTQPAAPAAPPGPAAPGASDPWASATSPTPLPASPPPPAPTQGSTLGGAANSVGSAISNPAGAVAGVFGFGGSPKPQPVAAPAAGTSRTLTAQTPDAVPPPAAFGAGMTEMLTTALVKADRFIVLERKDLGAIRSEQALGTDPIANADLAAKAGKILGAQALVRAVVTEYGTRSSASGVNSSYLRGVDLSRTSQSARVVVDVRIFDAETGQIMASERAEGSSSSTGLGVQVQRREGNLGTSAFGETPIGSAARDAIEKAVAFIVEKLDKVPWRGRIAEVDAGPDGTPAALYVNAGARIGLRKGDVLEVYSLGRQIVDPDTGTVIGQTGGIIGRCRLEEVNPDMSVAVPVSGAGFQKGANVRFLADAR
jgi:curli biogenesis system outer membrane secretion channel CsgG